MGLLDLIYPKICLNCKTAGRYICSSCISKMEFAKTICPECKKASIDGFTHIKCQRKLGINGLSTVWNYDGVIRRAIVSLKYKYATEIVSELVGYLLPLLKDKQILIPRDYCLVPVPMHWYRQNSRGFNQSEELAKAIARGMNWKFVPNLLLRKKLTTPQVELKREDRKKNVLGIFALNPKYNIRGINFILFDDVYTTGSTMKEAAKVLKRNGAERVWGLTVAK